MQPSAQGIFISYRSFSPLYVKSPPHRITSHQVYTVIIVLGHIPSGHPYEKTNLSPFSKPSLQCPALPFITVNSNCQSSVHHFCISHFSFESVLVPLPIICYFSFLSLMIRRITSSKAFAIRTKPKSLGCAPSTVAISRSRPVKIRDPSR